MKLFMLTSCSRVMETPGYLVDAFYKHATVGMFDFLIRQHKLQSARRVNDDFARRVQSFKPDLLYMQVGDHRIIEPEMVRALKIRLPNMIITQWCGDVREWPFAGVAEMGAECDCNFLANKTLIPVYEKMTGKPWRFWQHCTFSRKPQPDRKKWPHDVVLVANRSRGLNNSPLRQRLVDELSRRFGDLFAVYGSVWSPRMSPGPLDWRDQLDCMASAEVVVTCANHTCYDGYCSDRFFHALASGSCVIAKRFPGIDDLVRMDCDLLVWDSVPECVELVAAALGDSDIRNIGECGRETAVRRHAAEFRVLEYFLHLTELGLIKWPCAKA